MARNGQGTKEKIDNGRVMVRGRVWMNGEGYCEGEETKEEEGNLLIRLKKT